MKEKPQSTNLSRDVLSDLHSLLQSLLEHRPAPRYGKLGKVANSPFVVTVIGGVLLTFFALVWQGCEASRRDAASRADARRARKEALFAEFAADFESSLDLLVRLREMELWLLARSHDTDARYPVDARTFPEVRAAYLNLREGQWHRIKAPDSLCFRVCATFSNAEVRSAAAQLVDTIEAIELFPLLEPSNRGYRRFLREVYVRYREALSQGRSLLFAMLQELESAERSSET